MKESNRDLPKDVIISVKEDINLRLVEIPYKAMKEYLKNRKRYNKK